MATHVVYEGSLTNVYRQSDLNGYTIGTLTPGECFTYIGCIGPNPEIYFRNSSGQYTKGFIGNHFFGDLAYYGISASINGVGSCYRFKLRHAANVLNPNGSHVATLHAGDYVFTQGAIAGQSNPLNMHIVAYKKDGTLKIHNGFLTLSYTNGSMLNSNFCIMPA